MKEQRKITVLESYFRQHHCLYRYPTAFRLHLCELIPVLLHKIPNVQVTCKTSAYSANHKRKLRGLNRTSLETCFKDPVRKKMSLVNIKRNLTDLLILRIKVLPCDFLHILGAGQSLQCSAFLRVVDGMHIRLV